MAQRVRCIPRLNPLTLAAGTCSDAYFEVTVNRLSTAYDHTRNYHITATDLGGSASTPTPRQLYVEHLISQSRNGVTDIQLAPDVSGSAGTYAPVAAGGTMTLAVGSTYWIKLDTTTATQGYNQLKSFINIPNTIFQVLSVSSLYSADSSLPPTGYVTNPNDRLYADGCLWNNDPNSPNYRSCTGIDGKAGGTMSTTYQVKVIKVPTSPLTNPDPLNTLVYDFSGSSYHYNADFGASVRFANIVSASLAKSFSPKTILSGGTSKLIFTITNPSTTSSLANVNFIDNFPTGISVSSSPTVGYVGCGGTDLPEHVDCRCDLHLVYGDYGGRIRHLHHYRKCCDRFHCCKLYQHHQQPVC